MFGILHFEEIFHINSVVMFVIVLRINFKIPNTKYSLARGHKTISSKQYSHIILLI